MFSKLALPLVAALGVQNAQAGWDFFWCPEVTSLATPDFTAFSGTWYEIYRDMSHDYWSNEKCTTSVYDLVTTLKTSTAKSMMLTRSSKSQFWGGEGSEMTEAGLITFATGDGTGQEAYGSIFRQGTHQILETDNVSYAVVYGCQDWLGGLFGHFEWATLLSRTKYADARGVKNAKTKLTAIEYNWGDNWMKPGLECGMDAAPTADELFLTMIETKPDFLEYVYDDTATKYARYFFEAGDHFPTGFLTGPLTFGDKKNIQTPLKSAVTTSSYQSYFVIGPIAYSSSSTWNYQINMLSVGLSTEALASLTKLQSSPGSYYWQDYMTHLTGYARVIQFAKADKKIGAFREGEFANGSQVGFGRFMDNVSKTTMISYTGWWPTSDTADGIAVIGSSFTAFQGTFNKNSAFPMSGLDSLKTEKTISTLKYNA